MGDLDEGVSPAGTIVTGASADRINEPFREIVDAAVAEIIATSADSAVHVYGSVATGMARPGRSDVDMLTIDLDPATAAEIGRRLSQRFEEACRGVEIGAATAGDYIGDGDDAYGNRVFLRHYCVLLAGPDHDRSTIDFPADERGARGFNGDIDRHARRWWSDLDDSDIDAPVFATRIARKTLLAVAGLVSMHDRTWTTDRTLAARRWAEIHPELSDELTRLHAWVGGAPQATRDDVRHRLDSIVQTIIDQFAERIGLWPDTV